MIKVLHRQSTIRLFADNIAVLLMHFIRSTSTTISKCLLNEMLWSRFYVNRFCNYLALHIKYSERSICNDHVSTFMTKFDSIELRQQCRMICSVLLNMRHSSKAKAQNTSAKLQAMQLIEIYLIDERLVIIAVLSPLFTVSA